MSLPDSYIPILLQASVGIGFVAISLLGAHYLGPRQKKLPLQKIPVLSAVQKQKETQEHHFQLNIFLRPFCLYFLIQKLYFFTHMPSILENLVQKDFLQQLCLSQCFSWHFSMSGNVALQIGINNYLNNLKEKKCLIINQK